MTSNDVRDILSLPERSGSKPSSSSTPSGSGSSSRHRKSGHQHNPHPSQASSSRPKPKYDGMTRELFALLGDNAPTLAMAQGLGVDGKAASSTGAFFKPKFKRRKEKVRHWRWTPFLNPAREDSQLEEEDGRKGLVLHHWTRVNEDQDQKEEIERNYRFADFNTNSGAYSYSNDEYIQNLRDDDWTKEETDYLMDLCAQYDLRFVVIHDRYDWAAAQAAYLPAGPSAASATLAKERSMEDLKARYYAICRRLIRSRISTEDIESRQMLLSTYAFDKQREIERKKALARLYTRTPEQLAEEEALYVEIRRIEQNEAKYASEREELLRLLGGWESLPNSKPDAVAAAGSGLLSLLSGADEDASKGRGGKKRKLNQAIEESGTPGAEDNNGAQPAPPTNTRPSAQLTTKQRAELRQAQFDELQCITRFAASAGDVSGGSAGASGASSSRPPYAHLVGTASTLSPTTTNPSNPSAGHGVYLRSSRMLAPRPHLVLKTTQTLAEFTPPIGPRLIFPTAKNVEKWENLIGAVTTSLEMKKQLDRVNQELRIAKQRLAAAYQQQGQGQGHEHEHDRADRADTSNPEDQHMSSDPPAESTEPTVKSEDNP